MNFNSLPKIASKQIDNQAFSSVKHCVKVCLNERVRIDFA